jgi:peptidoglycan/LPS O-acetylase OafA/YrhL
MLWLGSLSYSLYLVHQNIGYGVITLSYNAGLPGWLGVGLAIIIALLLASLIHYYIEKPAQRQFRAWRSSTETAQTVGAPAKVID